jgi:hypothetical protein
MFSRKAEKTLPTAALRTFAHNHALEVPLLGTRMMLNGQLKRYHPAGIALKWRKKVVIIRVAVSGDTFSGKRLQV